MRTAKGENALGHNEASGAPAAGQAAADAATAQAPVSDSIAGMGAGALLVAIASGELSALELTEACLASIEADDTRINAVIVTDPSALEQAAASDDRRQQQTRPLDGIPVLVKDNVAVSGMPTTAGSRALAAHMPSDALVVRRLREAGAIILGKTNMSEWGNFRSSRATSGWSARGGQTRNPHVLDRSPSGSSSGSAAAVAAAFSPLAIGTETDGSIVCPAAACGTVGFKPSRGLVPGTGIVPISSAQDVAGPIARHVTDVALMFAVMADVPVPALRVDALRDARIGVWRPPDADALTRPVHDGVVAALTAAGATVVAIEMDVSPIAEPAWLALLTEFRHEIDAYLASAAGSRAGSLVELLAFNRADEVELACFGQENFERALAAPEVSDGS